MTDIETLKDILHREQLKEDEKHVGIPSWNRNYNDFCNKLGYNDLTTSNPKKITVWKEEQRIKNIKRENERRLKYLQRASSMLLIGSMYPFAILILLTVIINL